MVGFYGINVGKYTSPMDLGKANFSLHHLSWDQNFQDLTSFERPHPDAHASPGAWLISASSPLKMDGWS